MFYLIIIYKSEIISNIMNNKSLRSVLVGCLLLNSCTTTGVVDKLSGGIVTKLFEKKEDTAEVMSKSVRTALFGNENGQYKVTIDLSYLSKDGDRYLQVGQYYLAFKCYSYANNLYGMEACGEVARDKGGLKDYVSISQGFEDNPNFEHNHMRGYIFASKKGYKFRKPDDFYFPRNKKTYEQGYFENSFLITDRPFEKKPESLDSMVKDLSDKKVVIFEDSIQSKNSRANLIHLLQKLSPENTVFISDYLNPADLNKKEYDALIENIKQRNSRIEETKFLSKTDSDIFEQDLSLAKHIKELVKKDKRVFLSLSSERVYVHHLPFLLKQSGVEPCIVSQTSVEKYRSLVGLADVKILKIGNDWAMLVEDEK